MNDIACFKPRARILLQLGDQLIRNESIAVLELVKNTYDADAKEVEVIFKKIENPDAGEIIIHDDGEGMDLELIKTVWMEPGTDHKKKKFDERERTEKFKRLPLGEKGIGRFAVHKLGNEVEIVSRKKGKNEVYFKIDWERFEGAAYLEDVPITLYQRTPIIFTGEKTGTKITIKKLRVFIDEKEDGIEPVRRTVWDKKKIREVYRALVSLNSPFQTLDSFKVNHKFDRKDWIDDLLKFSEIKKHALFHVKATIENHLIRTLTYKFTPWKTLNKVIPRTKTETNIEMKIEERVPDPTTAGKKKKDWKRIDLSRRKIGKLKIELLMFDMDSNILAQGVRDKAGLKAYLNQNGGVRVFRDGVRIYDYGEPGNDWLELDSQRINKPSHSLSNNLVIGAIHIEREDSEELEEKTNREGFIENDAFNIFKDALSFTISQVEEERNVDKLELREKYGTINLSEPVIDSISKLKDKINKKVKDQKLRNELNSHLVRVEKEFKYVKEIYLRTSSAGLNLSIVIHEIEKLIQELNHVVSKQKVSKKIVKIAQHLATLVESYSNLIKNGEKSKKDLRYIINEALSSVEYRLDAHKIKLRDDSLNYTENCTIMCSYNLVVQSIMNIIDNSIYWLHYYGIKRKKILIRILDYYDGYKSILIADNGKGITLPVEAIVKPLISGKKDGGMGLGLHITSEVMTMHDGLLNFPDFHDLNIPGDYKNGALVMLSFKEEH